MAGSLTRRLKNPARMTNEELLAEYVSITTDIASGSVRSDEKLGDRSNLVRATILGRMR